MCRVPDTLLSNKVYINGYFNIFVYALFKNFFIKRNLFISLQFIYECIAKDNDSHYYIKYSLLYYAETSAQGITDSKFSILELKIFSILEQFPNNSKLF